MKIYLLKLDRGVVFHTEGPDPTDGDDAAANQPSRGLRGWLERRSQSLTDALTRSEGSIVSGFRRTWDWLHRWTAADEPLLRSLRQAAHFEILFPASMAPAAARRCWAHYLASRRRRHGIWLILNVLILPPAILAAVLPGPNVLGYWFAYRAVMHLLAWQGCRWARSRVKASVDRPLDELNETVDPNDEAQVSRLADRLGLPTLPDALRRLASGSSPHPVTDAHDATSHL